MNDPSIEAGWILVGNFENREKSAARLISGGRFMYCIFNDGTIERYTGSGLHWAKIPRLDANNFIGASEKLVGLTESGVPYIIGSSNFDEWTLLKLPNGVTHFWYIFGGSHTQTFFAVSTYCSLYYYHIDTELWVQISAGFPYEVIYTVVPAINETPNLFAVSENATCVFQSVLGRNSWQFVISNPLKHKCIPSPAYVGFNPIGYDEHDDTYILRNITKSSSSANSLPSAEI